MFYGKRGNQCHSDMSGVMGNSQNIESSHVVMTVNGHTLLIPRWFYTKSGMLRKKYFHEVADAILSARRNANASKAVAA